MVFSIVPLPGRFQFRPQFTRLAQENQMAWPPRGIGAPFVTNHHPDAAQIAIAARFGAFSGFVFETWFQWALEQSARNAGSAPVWKWRRRS
jgi:hypothetical protein